MTDADKNTIIAIWNDLVLRKRLEDAPYGLSQQELLAIRQNDELQRFIGNTPAFTSTRDQLAQRIEVF